MGSAVELLATQDPEQDRDDEDSELQVYEKYDHMLHSGSRKRK